MRVLPALHTWSCDELCLLVWSHCLAHKLSQLDGESSASLLSSGSARLSVEEQLAAHQHRCEEWAREQVKHEVSGDLGRQTCQEMCVLTVML